MEFLGKCLPKGPDMEVPLERNRILLAEEGKQVTGLVWRLPGRTQAHPILEDPGPCPHSSPKSLRSSREMKGRW